MYGNAIFIFNRFVFIGTRRAHLQIWVYHYHAPIAINIASLIFFFNMSTEDSKDLKWFESNEMITPPSSRIENTGEILGEQTEITHKDKQPETNGLDRGPEYIARLQAGLEETLSKPRKGTHVTDLVLCSRLRVFREIDPLPIDAKTLAIFATGMAFHGVYQWLLLRDSRRFEREKHLEFRGIMGSVDIYDKIRNIPLEFKTTRASSIMKPKPWHVQQLKYYIAMLNASQGYIIYQLLMHFGNAPFKTFKIAMTAQERKDQLDKLVDEADSLKRAMDARDPSLAKPVYDDPKLNWLCRDCPYQVDCKRIQEAACAA
jgi:CRISPR/Cas system-associated exonuclease Cas4 (RecB family)